MNNIWRWYPQKKGKKSGTILTQDQKDASGPSVDRSTVCWSLIRNKTGRKGWDKRNGTRTELKICGNKFYGEINPPQSLNLIIVKAVWDHLDRERNTRQPTSKEELWNVFQVAWRTISEDYLKNHKKACLRGFRLSWRMKIGGPNVDFQTHYKCRNSVFSYPIFLLMFAHVSINHRS